jgi:lipopolysaccharide export system permease protein
MLPSFFLGVLVFISILLLFQALRLTEFVLIHGGELTSVLRIMMYLMISFLPVILPMSLLFAVLLTYGRLSSDSEIVAMKALGLSIRHFVLPAAFLALLTALLSAQTSFYLAPWGNRQFELLISDISKMKASATIREGVFSEGFFKLVVYANKVDSEKGKLKNVFIYDERDRKSPITIIAKNGLLVKTKDETGQGANLKLINGSMHKTHEAAYTKIDFDAYEIKLFDPAKKKKKKKSFPSFTIDEVKKELKKDTLSAKKRIRFEIEYHRRWALSVACLIFGLIGVSMGISPNKRSGKSNGFVLSIGLIVAYWILYAAGESLAKGGTLPTSVAIWLANGSFVIAMALSFRPHLKQD